MRILQRLLVHLHVLVLVDIVLVRHFFVLVAFRGLGLWPVAYLRRPLSSVLLLRRWNPSSWLVLGWSPQFVRILYRVVRLYSHLGSLLQVCLQVRVVGVRMHQGVSVFTHAPASVDNWILTQIWEVWNLSKTVWSLHMRLGIGWVHCLPTLKIVPLIIEWFIHFLLIALLANLLARASFLPCLPPLPEMVEGNLLLIRVFR